jgi:hypothetical protein
MCTSSTSPPSAGSWVDTDVTALAGGVAATLATALDGYWGSDSSQHVNFISFADGHVHELYITPGRSLSKPAPHGRTDSAKLRESVARDDGPFAI